MEILNPETTMKPLGGYSQGTVVGDMIFVAGQAAVDANMQFIGKGDIAAQTRQTIANIEAVLEAAGASLHDVVSTTVYVKNFDAYGDFDKAYCECFGSHKPARATVRADMVAPQMLVEIQAIAVRDS